MTSASDQIALLKSGSIHDEEEMRKLLLPIIVLVTLAACQTLFPPRYTTRYTITQTPQTAYGQACAAQCLAVKQQGEQFCMQSQQQCISSEQQRAAWEYQQDTHKRQSEGRMTQNPSYYDRSARCTSDTACTQSVQTNFQMCYTSCGGQMVPQTVCTENCGNQ